MATTWEECYGHQWCVHVPLDGNKCFSVHACVRVISEGAKYYLEAQLNGITKRIDLGDACVEIPVSLFHLRVCVSNLLVGGIHPGRVQFDISIGACISVDVGPVGIHECVDLAKKHVVIGRLSAAERDRFFGVEHTAGDPFYVYYSRAATDKESKDLDEARAAFKWTSS